MRASPSKSAVQICLGYAVLAALWILFSDRLLGLLVTDTTALTRLQTYKGWLFVAVTAAILYLVLQSLYRMPALAAEPAGPAPPPARWRSVRWRLVAMVTVVFLPLALLTVLRDLERYRTDATSVRDRLMSLAESASADESELLEFSRQMLEGLALVPAVRGGDPVACPALLGEWLKRNPQFLNLGVATPSGDVICSARSLPGPVNMADLPAFQRARDSGEFAVGDYTVGRVTGLPTLHLACPARDADGQLRLVVYAALNPQWLSRFVIRNALLKGTTVMVVDRQGTIVARSLDPQQWVGRAVPESPLREAIRSRPLGVAELAGVDGVMRVHAFHAVPASHGSLFVSVGITRAEVYAGAHAQWIGDLQILALVVVLVVLGSWIFADLFILRHTRRLTTALQRMHENDLTVRSGVPYAAGELGQIARAFDGLAATLETRTREREGAVEALRRNELRYRALVENSSDIITILDVQSNFRYASPSVERLLGYRPAELVGHGPFEFVHPDDLPAVRQTLATAVVSPGVLLTQEFRFRHRDGSWRHLAGVGQNLLATEGIEGFIICCRDVTEHKRAEEALRESEGMFRSLSASSPMGILLFDADGRVTYSNPRCRQILGLSLTEAMGEGWLRLVHPEDGPRLAEQWTAAVRARQEYHHEFRLLGRHGTERWASIRTAPIRNDRDGVTGYVGTLEDITEHHQADQQLRLQAAALQSAANGIAITDREGRLVWVNDAFTRLTGYAMAEVLGQNPRILKSGKHDAAFYRDLWTTILAGRVWRGELVNKRKDGSLYTEEMTITPVRNERDEITHFIAIKQDVTEKKDLEERFRQSQKMEAVGRLAGGVAHDFNNILTAIIGYNQMLLQRLDPASPLAGHAREVDKAAERAAGLTRQLLAFSRRQVLLPQALDINAVVAGLEPMLCRLIGEDIQLVTVPGPELWPVKADHGQLEQVIMNLAVNARDAMPGGGKLTIETANTELDEEYARSHPEVVAGPHVMLAVADTGVGMTPEVQARVFEPFFTTKGLGKGTGLGLATCFGIIKQSGGHITLSSEVGQGTVFKIYLPRTAEPVATAEAELRAAPVPGGTETILMVEDETTIRELGGEVLRELGYTVLTAANGAEALGLAAQHRDQAIHLLVTDVVMPQMGGRELAERFRGLHPESAVLYTSGYTEDAVVQYGVIQQGIAFLQKPYTVATLARKVREVLDAGGKSENRPERSI